MSKRSMIVAAALLLGATSALGQGQSGKPKSKDNAYSQGSGQATGKPLFIGDRAPELTIEKWVKGDAITGFEKGKVYVVEFWATWCGPCVASMPHLSDLQKEYKDKGVTIIGVTSADPNNSLSDVEAMADEKGDAMGYTVAWDTDRKTNTAWMKAARQRSIPTAFIVNQEGQVAFIGHPMKIDEPLKQIVARKYDLGAAADKFRQQQEKDSKAAEVNAQLNKFMDHLRAGETEAAYALGNELLKGAGKDNAQVLNGIAWSIVDPAAQLKNQDLTLAQKAAERANDLTKGKDPYILDTLARVWFLKGNTNKAEKFQKQAIDNIGTNEQLRKELQERLAEYQKK